MIISMLGEPASTDQLAATVRDLGVVAMRFGEVERETRHPDGKRRETDTTHTVMLALVACALAERINNALPDGSADRVNVGQIAQYAIVHDLPEVYAGDTATLRLPTGAETAAKAAREEAAVKLLDARFVPLAPWVSLTLRSYERRLTKESLFVRAVDKIMPKITHVENGAIVPHSAGMTVDELAERYRVQREQMVEWAGRWPVVIDLYDHLVAAELDALRHGR